MPVQTAEGFLYFGQDGQKYTLTSPPSRFILSEAGLGMPEINYVTQRGVFQHGETMRSYFLGVRIIELRIRHSRPDRNAYWASRALLLDGIRPNRGAGVGRLRKRLSTGEVREITAVIASGPGFEARDPSVWDENGYTETLQFVCHNPIWYDPAVQSSVLSPVAVATFPMTFPVTFLAYSASGTITYAGTWDEYPTIVITGPIKTPSITNQTTGQKIALNTTIPSGMSVTITLNYDTKLVERSDGLNLVGTVSSDSDLAGFHLTEGVNTLVVEGDNASSATTFTLTYYHRYIGI